MMLTNGDPAIRVHADPSNPGQFFACCGLLEFADRLWDGAEGWFEDGTFCVRKVGIEGGNGNGIGALLCDIAKVPLTQIDPSDDYSSPIELATPVAVRIDWWKDVRTGSEQLKVWAGSMRVVRIARAMQATLKNENHTDDILNYYTVVYDPDESDKKVEPFYFDARRGVNALGLDIGFMPDRLSMTTTAYPAVEFLCLVGLQRFRPVQGEMKRIFEYHTWSLPLTTPVASLAVAGLLPFAGTQGYRFQIAFRTDQKKHKAFMPAIPMERNKT